MSGMDISSLFGGGGSMYSDYASIRNGSYKRLLKSYYGGSSWNPASGSSGKKETGQTVLDRIIEERKNPTVSKQTSEANAALNSGVSSLKTALSTLQKEDTFKDTQQSTDPNTGAVTQSAKTSSEKIGDALKSYVDTYNSTVKAAKKSNNTGMTSHVADMMKETKENEERLKETGIRINSDGTLTLDKTRAQKANVNEVKGLFASEDKNSYGSKVSQSLNGASRYASNSVTNTKETGKTESEAGSVTASGTDLMADIEALTGTSLFSKIKTKNASGAEVEDYDVDGITSRTKNFVKNYNDLIGSARLLGNEGVASNLGNLLTKTKNSAGALKSIGIGVDKNGNLSLDEKKFKTSDMSEVQKVLKSYASSIEANASLVKYYASTNAGSKNAYNQNGSYYTPAAGSFNGTV